LKWQVISYYNTFKADKQIHSSLSKESGLASLKVLQSQINTYLTGKINALSSEAETTVSNAVAEDEEEFDDNESDE
jgi:hypothetical protein